MESYNNLYAQQIYSILVPLIGDGMARSVIKFQSYKLGKNEELLTENDLSKLAKDIKVGLLPFLGSDTAGIISSRITSIK